MGNFQGDRRAFIYLFIFFNKYSLSTYDNSDTVLGARNISQIKSLSFWNLYSNLGGHKINKEIVKLIPDINNNFYEEIKTEQCN